MRLGLLQASYFSKSWVLLRLVQEQYRAERWILMTHQGKELSGDAAQPMLDLQHRWVEALVKGDTGALDTILVDTYVDTDESGSRFDKTGVLTAISSWRR
jgi:hypothetical protein